MDSIFEKGIDFGVQINGWVILTNHYHLLARVEDFSVLKQFFHRIHGGSSREWNLEDSARGRKVWHRYSDRAIRSERHYFTSLNYIHYNPVKHGLKASPYDWEISSVHWYLDSFGKDWLRDSWVKYPVLEYGKGWDTFQSEKIQKNPSRKS